MKMTLHIDEALLDRVAAVYGCESKTAAVNLALSELDRRHRMRSYAEKGLGFPPDVLRDAVDPDYDLMANRNASGAGVSAKHHGRRRTR
jgi:hypothetical protein